MDYAISDGFLVLILLLSVLTLWAWYRKREKEEELRKTEEAVECLRRIYVLMDRIPIDQWKATFHPFRSELEMEFTILEKWVTENETLSISSMVKVQIKKLNSLTGRDIPTRIQ